jgi:uncharacterized protein (DUF983 family)
MAPRQLTGTYRTPYTLSVPPSIAKACPYCGHPGIHRGGGQGRSSCENCDRCWAERQQHERPPHHN